MRETCARVLAAALMTGTIASVVWMSALGGTPNQTIRPLAAPAAAPPLSVRIHVKPVQVRPKPVRRVRIARPATPSVRVATVTTVTSRPLAAAHPRRPKRPPRHLASAPPPKAAAVPPTEAVPGEAPQLIAPAPVETVDDHGNGHAYGHDKARGKGHEQHED